MTGFEVAMVVLPRGLRADLGIAEVPAVSRILAVALVCGCAGAPQETRVEQALPVTHVVSATGPIPYAVYDLRLRGGHGRVPATGVMDCATSSDRPVQLRRHPFRLDIDAGPTAGWSVLRIVHETGARTLYRIETVALPERAPCEDPCIELDVGEQESYSAAGVRSYAEGTPRVIEVRLSPTGDRFVFIGVSPGNTSVLLIKDDGTQERLHLRVRGAMEQPSDPPATPSELEFQCTEDTPCAEGECVHGLCAQWIPIDC